MNESNSLAAPPATLPPGWEGDVGVVAPGLDRGFEDARLPETTDRDARVRYSLKSKATIPVGIALPLEPFLRNTGSILPGTKLKTEDVSFVRLATP